MNRLTPGSGAYRRFLRPMAVGSPTSRLGPFFASQRLSCTQSQQQKPTTQCKKTHTPLSALRAEFWTSRATWGRAAVNTLRCLVGCTIGDFSAMWMLQAQCPDMGVGAIMGISMASGLSTSMMLETVLLRYGRDNMPWMTAAKTAVGMSIISMLTMEMAQNIVDYHLTGGVVQLDSPQFWLAAAISMGAGFLTPLPYNYIRLRKFGKACH